MIRRVRGFKTMRTASATIKGFEIMRMIRHGHCMPKEPGAKGEVRFVNNLFGIAA
jgi:transposase, IS6 family